MRVLHLRFFGASACSCPSPPSSGVDAPTAGVHLELTLGELEPETLELRSEDPESQRGLFPDVLVHPIAHTFSEQLHVRAERIQLRLQLSWGLLLLPPVVVR